MPRRVYNFDLNIDNNDIKVSRSQFKEYFNDNRSYEDISLYELYNITSSVNTFINILNFNYLLFIIYKYIKF